MTPQKKINVRISSLKRAMTETHPVHLALEDSGHSWQMIHTEFWTQHTSIVDACTDHMIDNQYFFATYKHISHERHFVEGIACCWQFQHQRSRLKVVTFFTSCKMSYTFLILRKTCSHPMLLCKNPSSRFTWQMGVMFLTTERS